MDCIEARAFEVDVRADQELLHRAMSIRPALTSEQSSIVRMSSQILACGARLTPTLKKHLREITAEISAI